MRPIFHLGQLYVFVLFCLFLYSALSLQYTTTDPYSSSSSRQLLLFIIYLARFPPCSKMALIQL